MRPRTALGLLAILAIGVIPLCNRRLPGRRQQAPSSPAAIERRPLTPEEAIRLCRGRAVVDAPVTVGWRLSPEDAARVAMAWPANTHPMPERLQ
ncbi:hypothetical protein [uncultured Methylobacterium sp.]|uniref:hypothetical protein n=1 Tax=uncultured Methylobacterium sp. TaxID=157278 RepID=UPI0035CA2115